MPAMASVTRHFGRKAGAQKWIDEQTAKLVPGTHVVPRTARTTVGEWCDTWLAAEGPSDSCVYALHARLSQRAVRSARRKVPGLLPGFRYHDLRHYFASLLIASGADVKVVQARLRHASAKTTLDTYGHLWPDSDDSTRAAVDLVLAARAGKDNLRTAEGETT